MGVFYEFDDVDAFTTGTVGVPGMARLRRDPR